ncbi:MAG: hypothetical protein Q9227_002065 [Pyrenula ochraceoflavens]
MTRSWSKQLSALTALALATAIHGLPHSTLAPRATNFCGDTDYQVIQGTPWIVYNMLYNSKFLSSSESWCTVYDGLTTAADGTQQIQWGSTSTISSASDTVKGYSFIGLTQGLSNTLDSIGSVPASYSWTRTNTTEFKGNIVFDFMTNDVKGDSTSTDSHELMLWLQYEGGQLPIGYSKTPTKIDNLFGTSWSLYSGKNTDTGITVTSMLADTQFDGTFTGDLMDWFNALVGQGLFKSSTYLNVGNAGTEIFYGDSTMSSTLGLQINLGTSNKGTSSSAAANAVSSVTAAIQSSSIAITPTTTAVPVEMSSSAAAPVLSVAATSSSFVNTVASSTENATAPAATGLENEEDNSCEA